MACFPQETLVLSNMIAVPLLLRDPPSDGGAPKVKSGDTRNATRLTFYKFSTLSTCTFGLTFLLTARNVYSGQVAFTEVRPGWEVITSSR
jgi:hypothetical protein